MSSSAPEPRVRLVRTDGLTASELAALRDLCDLAFRDPGDPPDLLGFTDEDWEHACGGVHAIVLGGGVPLAHASVVERELHVDGVPFRAGYVEAVATRPDVQRRGFGTAAMHAATEHIIRTFELGALDTSSHAFFERLGWERWRGSTFVRVGGELVATPEEDDQVMVLRTGATRALDLGAPISCDRRSGDVW